MRKPLEIPVPTAEELEALEMLYRGTHDVRLRTRAQIKGANPLRNGRFNPCLQSIPLLEGFSVLSVPGRLESHMLCLWSDG